MVVLHVFLLGLSLTSALYSSSSPVVKLTQENFEREVLKSDSLWIVEFFAPWCGHCKNLAPEYEKAAKALKGIVKLGAVDMDVEKTVGNPYGISGFPTLKFFGDNKKAPSTYESGRTAKDIIAFCLKQAEEIANKRIGAKPEPSQKSESKESKEAPPANEEDVIVLDDNNFEENVLGSNDIWFVEFYAPWCGHCKALTPEWAKAATNLKGQVKVAKINADVEKKFASKYQVNGFPTIKIFLPGQDQPEDYNGGREAGSITRIALEKLDSSGKPPTITQLTSAEGLEKDCGKIVCVLVFLPHIYDSSANERNKYLETIVGAVKNNRGKPLKFLWAQAGDFYKFEQLVGLGAGYPSVVGLSMAKTRTGIMRSAFNLEEINTFVRKLLAGGVPLTEYKELPKIGKVDAWDGNDHQPENLEESDENEKKAEL